jgi:hypothetical protein
VQVSLACHSHVPTKHVFFETTGMLLMFVTIGKFIEAYAKRRSFAAISNLLKLQPREVSHCFVSICLGCQLAVVSVIRSLPLRGFACTALN